MVRTLAGLALIAQIFAATPARADDWLGRDKALHFSFSVVLGGAGYGGSALFLEKPWARALAGAGFSLTLGGAKELYDIKHGDPSWKDFTWDAAGTAVGLGVGYLVDLAIRRRRRSDRHRPALALTMPSS